jgi:hypothetical protein
MFPMQQQFSSDEPQPLVHQAESSSMVQARIDAYLNRTCAPLFLSLPYEEATQQRAEMQAHLESMVAAHIKLGHSEIEAVTLALEQFGKEHSVAQAWKQECEETKAESGRGTFWSAIRPVAGYSLLNWAVWLLIVKVFEYLVNGLARSGVYLSEFLVWVALAVCVAQYTLFPAFLGFLVGRRVRGRTLAVALLALPCIITLCGALVLKAYNGFHLFQWQPESLFDIRDPETLLPFGLNLGFGAMGVGAALLRRRRTRRLAGNR